MAHPNTTRRQLLQIGTSVAAYAAGAAIVAGGVAVTSEARSSTMTPFRIAELRYRAAVKRFNGLPEDLESRDASAFEREQDAYTDALTNLDAAPIADFGEFTDAFDLICAGGESVPGRELIAKLIADAHRLAREARA